MGGPLCKTACFRFSRASYESGAARCVVGCHVVMRTAPAPVPPHRGLLYSAGLCLARPGRTCLSMPLTHMTTGGQGVVGSNPALPTQVRGPAQVGVGPLTFTPDIIAPSWSSLTRAPSDPRCSWAPLRPAAQPGHPDGAARDTPNLDRRMGLECLRLKASGLRTPNSLRCCGGVASR
jgi:hypothetical protein